MCWARHICSVNGIIPSQEVETEVAEKWPALLTLEYHHGLKIRVEL